MAIKYVYNVFTGTFDQIDVSSGGTPGGSDTQVQYNNAGAFGGISGATTNGTTLTITSGRATTDFSPTSNDGASLGTSALGFSDIFLASGGVANWNNGNVTLTHSSNLLTFSGGASTLFSFAKKVGFGTITTPTYQAEFALGSNYIAWTGNNSLPQPAYVTLRGYLSGNNPQFDIDLVSGGVAAQTYVFTASGIDAPGVTVGTSAVGTTSITTRTVNHQVTGSSVALSSTYLRSGVAALGATGFAASSSDYEIRLGGSATIDTGTQVMSASTSSVSFPVGITLSATNIVTDTTTGMKIGTATTQKLGFFNATPVVQPTALTAQLTTLTFTNPGTPDYAIQDLTNIGGYGFVTSDEAQTTLSVIANLQTRVGQLETKLQALGLLA